MTNLHESNENQRSRTGNIFRNGPQMKPKLKTKNKETIMKTSISVALPLALLVLSACGSSGSTRIVDPPRPLVYPDGYFKMSYVDSGGKTWFFGAPLQKEGRVYQETVVPELPAVPPSEMSVELDLPESAIAKTKEEYFPELSYPGGFTELVYRNEELHHQDGQIVFTTRIVDLDEFLPGQAPTGKLIFQLADDSGSNHDEMVEILFRKPVASQPEDAGRS